MGDGKRYLFSQSPLSRSQMQTLLSVDADRSCARAKLINEFNIVILCGKIIYFVTVPRPTQRTNRMHMGGYNFRNASRKEVPDYDATIIAADRQQCAVFVECTSDGQRNAIE